MSGCIDMRGYMRGATAGRRPDYYALAADGETLVPYADSLEWILARTAQGETAWSEYGRVGNWFGVNSAGERVQVSTVFLGIDHNFSMVGPPVLWETMVFGCPEGGKLDQYCNRYTSAKDAKRGHHWYVWLMQRLGFTAATEEPS